MKRGWITRKLGLVLSVFLFLGGSIYADEQKLTLSTLPAAAQETVKTQLSGAVPGGIEQNKENGEVVYDIEMTKSGTTRSISVAASGRLVSAEVFLPEAPAAVQKTIREHWGTDKFRGTELDGIDRSTSKEDGGIVYDVEMKKNGATRSFSVAEDGRLISTQVFLSEIPAAVQKVIKEQQGTGTIGDIDQTTEDGEMIYETDVSKGEKNRSLRVAADAKWFSIEMELSEAPMPVERTVQRLPGRNAAELITKRWEEGEIRYCFDAMEKGKKCSYEIGPHGKVRRREEEITLAEAPAVVQGTIKVQLGNGKLRQVSKVNEDDQMSYEVETTKGGKEYNFSVAENGGFLGTDD